ncbi:MAG: DNA internalization-related competence protein ComEC/Rec2 [Firmicutes bacterium]|nr:DNA internalization-related competence protein ComEC/Rec2 [Bacillota bacterium]
MDYKMEYGTIATFIGIIFAYLFKPSIFMILFCTSIILILFYFINKFISRKIAFFIITFCSISMIRYTLVTNYESKLKPFEDKLINADLIILEENNKKDNVSDYIAECIGILEDDKYYSLKEKVVFKDYNKSNYKAGDIIKTGGHVSEIVGKRNFGDNDISLYFNSKGIYFQLIGQNSNLVGRANSFKVLFFYNVRSRISNIINKSLPTDEAAFLNAVIIGDKHYLDAEEKDNFSKTGLSHILSISGLHVAFIVYLLNAILKVLKIKGNYRDILSSILIAYYIAMIGVPPPALRSFIMMLIFIWGKHIRRDYDISSAASLAAILMLLHNPLLVHNQGFIISFACIYSIAFLFEPIYTYLGKVIHITPIRNAIALSLSIQTGTAPVLIYYFNYISLISILVNIIAVPLVFFIIATGFIGVIFGAIIPIIGVYIFSLDYYFISLLSKIISIASALPYSGLHIPSLHFLMYLLYYFAVIMICYKDNNFILNIRKQKYAFVSVSLAMLIFVFAGHFYNNNVRLVFLDVGQGDSSLITTTRGRHILIDGGGSAGKGDFYYDVGGKITVPALLKLGVWSIDTIIISHIHEDHLEGLLKAVETFKTEKVILPDTPYESEISRSFLSLCKSKGVKILYAKDGDKLVLDKNTEINFLFPEESLIISSNSDENNNSLVALFSYKNFKVLYTGDIEKDGENRLLNKSIKADIIKVPHHGSNTSSTKEFIETVSPKFSVISVGKNNFGHPREEVVDRLKENSHKIFRTDKNGAVLFKTNGKKVIIKTVRNCF